MSAAKWNSLVKGFHKLLLEKGVERIKGGSESSLPFNGKVKRTYSITLEENKPLATDVIAYFQERGIEMEGRNGTLH